MSNDNKNLFEKILRLLKLETTTKHGRVNLAGIIVIAFFALLYTASDVLNRLIDATADVAKTITLGENVYTPYETTSVLETMIPLAILVIVCLLYLHFHENAKIKRDDDVKKENGQYRDSGVGEANK